MLTRYILYLAQANLRHRRLRSILTIGGIVIGIGSIVFLVSFGFGLQRLIKDRVTNIEALTVLDVSPGESLILRIDDTIIEQLKALDHVTAAAPSANISGQIAYQGSATDIAVFGTDPEFAPLEGLRTVDAGRNLTESSLNDAIITSTAVELLGLSSNQDIIGETVNLRLFVPEETPVTGGETETTTRIADLDMEIIGVVNDAELSIAYIPLSLVQGQGIGTYSAVKVKVDSRENLEPVRAMIENLGFRVDSLADTVGQIDQIFTIFQVVMAGFGLVAMFVASLGSFNTLTVSLLERTREVGMMKALGAKNRDIYQLFLSESWLMAVSGGLLGIIIGYGFGQGVNLLLNYLAGRFGGQPVDVFSTPWLFIVIMFAVALTIGFITGIYPARRAAKINPLEYE